MTRESLSKRIRFEVFKRDGFTCQYCGKKAPDVVLHVDHIAPVAKGGQNDILNLVTSCVDCNLGKGARELSDNSVVEKQRQQLEDLQERHEQIEMMLEWKSGLLDLEAEQARGAASYWEKLAPGWTVSKDGLVDIKKWVGKFGLDEVIEAMRISADQYIITEDGKTTDESWNCAFEKIPRICSVRSRPEMSDLYYIRGILRNKFRNCDLSYAIGRLKYAFRLGATIESLKAIALRSDSWYEWMENMEFQAGALESISLRGGRANA